MNFESMKKDLLADEGLELSAYQDTLGYWTIGVGRLIDKKRGGGITREEAIYLLGNDITKVYNQLTEKLPFYSRLSDGVQRALCNMAFQLGIEGLLGFKTTLSLVEQGKYAEAAESALKSKWAQQTPARARKVTDLLRRG